MKDMYALVQEALDDRGVHVHLPSPEHQVTVASLQGDTAATIRFKRDDLISPLFPGNKFRKLVPHLFHLLTTGETAVSTFGGAYSNHLYAFGSAVRVLGLEGTAYIRGEHTEPLNPILSYLRSAGVQLQFIDRESYRKHRAAGFRHSDATHLVPEGGTDDLAVQSVAMIADEVHYDPEYVVTAVGTGGTLAGLARGFSGRSHIYGVSSLKGATSLDGDVRALTIGHATSWQLDHDHHFGGYARTTPELWAFMHQLSAETGIVLDPVYTAKALAGLRDLIRFKPSASQFLFIHTGGIPIDTSKTLKNSRR